MEEGDPTGAKPLADDELFPSFFTLLRMHTACSTQKTLPAARVLVNFAPRCIVPPVVGHCPLNDLKFWHAQNPTFDPPLKEEGGGPGGGGGWLPLLLAGEKN